MPDATDPVLALIGARLAAARYAAGLTQDQAARAAGLTRSSIANIEYGRQDVPVSKLACLIRAYSADPAAIIQARDIYAGGSRRAAS